MDNATINEQHTKDYICNDSWVYSRFEDLSNLILVSDIRYAAVAPPISQGKAPKWHGGIHLSEAVVSQKPFTFHTDTCMSELCQSASSNGHISHLKMNLKMRIVDE